MSINYILKSIEKLDNDSLMKFMLDILTQGLEGITDFNEEEVYTKGEKVYVYKDGKHQVYKCIVENTTPGPMNLDEEWSDLFY